MSLKYLVFGGSGQLGLDLTDEIRRGGGQVTALGHASGDVTNPAAVKQAIDASRPDAVINCAAWTRVDAAEDHEAEAELVNATGAGIVAAACAAAGVRLCHLSTDYVFDGLATEPIDEDAPTAPQSTYGRTKLHGEEAVRSTAPDHLIVRTGWLYGRQGPNFVVTMLRLAKERPEVRVVDDQHGGPTWTGHLAPALLRLIEIAPPGTYHLTNSGVTTWFELAVAAIRARGLNTAVVPITTAEYPTAATRPAYSVLDNRRWRELGEPPLPAWETGLAAYLASLERSR
ncbi:MAG: dTDP-4-dehydrorhamnose reductase [Candidatus Dormiibacterota bacterium]